MAFFRCGAATEIQLPDSFSINIYVDASADAQHDTGNRNATVALSSSGSGTVQLGKNLYDYTSSPSGRIAKEAINSVSVSRTIKVTFTKRK